MPASREYARFRLQECEKHILEVERAILILRGYKYVKHAMDVLYKEYATRRAIAARLRIKLGIDIPT